MDETNTDQEVALKQKKCLSKPTVRVAALVIGIALAGVAILSAYAAGVFDSGPDLPEMMEGEVTFTTDDGKGEAFHVLIDYKRNIVQLTSLENLVSSSPLSGRRLMSVAENKTSNASEINATKIVIQDYNTGKKYFIVPANRNSTTKCIYTSLEGDIIPRHLLKYATLISENAQGNITHSHFKVDNDTEVDVYRAKGHNGKIYEIYLHLPNGTMHIRSKEKEMNFTDYKRLNCYKYIEENDTIEEFFYKSNDSKLYQETDTSIDPAVELPSNLTQFLNETASLRNDSTTQQLQQIARRRRRGLGFRGGGLDWWYGNWCGPYQGGYMDHPNPTCKKECKKSTSYVTHACRQCLPPKDGLDEACMEHDRCLVNAGWGPWWCNVRVNRVKLRGNRCTCDYSLVWSAYWQMFACPTFSCKFHAWQVYYVFRHFLSCWYPARICFPWFRFVCDCKWCECPRITIHWRCISFKMCAYLGSGEVWW